jgi:hypothetical protein
MICSLCGKEIVGSNYGRNANGYCHEICNPVEPIVDTNEVNTTAGSKARDYWTRLEGVKNVPKRPLEIVKEPDSVLTEAEPGLIKSDNSPIEQEPGIQSDDSLPTGSTDYIEPIIA